MIKKISLKNFRSHADTELEFSPGVNVIVGLPNKGKTNILRALQWVFFNRPLGQRVRSKFTTKATRVGVEVDDVEVSLVLGKKGKRYEVKRRGEVRRYKAVGSSVPDVVTGAFNLSEVSIQKQLDTPFLITSSGADISKTFNRITRLEKVDVWLKRLNSRLLSKGKEKGLLEGQVREKKERVKQLKGIQELQEKLESILKLERRKNLVDVRAFRLATLIGEVEKATKAEELYKRLPDLLERFEEWEVKNNRLTVLDNQVEDLESMVLLIRSSVAKVNQLDQDIVEMMKNYKARLLKNKRCPFCPVCTTDVKKHTVEKLLEGV